MTDRTPEQEKDWWNLTVLGALSGDIDRLRTFLHSAEEDWLDPEAALPIYGHLADTEEFAKDGKDREAREAINLAREAYIQAYTEFQKRSV
jgi:hypothetical protein